MKQIYFEDVDLGTLIPEFTRKISLLDLVQYSASTWNFYLMHIEKDFAQKSGFRDANIHAPFFGAFFATMISKWIGDPGRLIKLEYRVNKMGFPGDTITGKGTVISKYCDSGKNLIECDIWVENQHETKVATGSVTLSLRSLKD